MSDQRDHGGRYALSRHLDHLERTRERHGRISQEAQDGGVSWASAGHLARAAESLRHAEGHAQQGAVTESRKHANEAGRHLELATKAHRMVGFAPQAVTPRPRAKG